MVVMVVVRVLCVCVCVTLCALYIHAMYMCSVPQCTPYQHPTIHNAQSPGSPAQAPSPTYSPTPGVITPRQPRGYGDDAVLGSRDSLDDAGGMLVCVYGLSHCVYVIFC